MDGKAILLVDNRDSFTWNLAHDLERAGQRVARGPLAGQAVDAGLDQPGDRQAERVGHEQQPEAYGVGAGVGAEQAGVAGEGVHGGAEL